MVILMDPFSEQIEFLLSSDNNKLLLAIFEPKVMPLGCITEFYFTHTFLGENINKTDSYQPSTYLIDMTR